jgi:C4-dicarboxylate-specific signal transduction histidine kinase
MAAAITHEINNPLGVILGRVEMLRSLLADETLDRNEVLKIVDSIEITGQRIEKIVRSMKTMAHHQEEEATQKIAVRDLIGDALDLCQNRFEKNGIKIQIPESEMDLVVDCRSHQIVQVLVNLFNNSFDAIHQKDEKWLKIEIRDLKEMVEISVTDSGHGIPEAVQQKMFNPFFSTKAVQYGTGLGLSISQSILQKNGGILKYDSQSPNTRFILRLPKRQSLN